MPDCKNCGSYFPNRVKIDGVVRVIANRKYCFVCSPFGQHNTRQIHVPVKERKKRDYAHKYFAEARQKRKATLVELKGGKCCICSYNRCLGALDFHHIDPANKKFPLSSGSISSIAWERILEEVDKTVLLCKVCHAEVEAGLHKCKEDQWRKDKSRNLCSEYLLSRTGDTDKYFYFKCKQCNKDFVPQKTRLQYCSADCYYIAIRKCKRPTLDELQEMLSNMPWSAIARNYGVRDNTVRKWARKYGICKPEEAKQRELKQRKFSPLALRRSIEANSKSYTLLNPNGGIVTITNMRKFCSTHKLNPYKMSQVARGKRRQHKGWRFPTTIIPVLLIV